MLQGIVCGDGDTFHTMSCKALGYIKYWNNHFYPRYFYIKAVTLITTFDARSIQTNTDTNIYTSILSHAPHRMRK